MLRATHNAPSVPSDERQEDAAAVDRERAVRRGVDERGRNAEHGDPAARRQPAVRREDAFALERVGHAEAFRPPPATTASHALRQPSAEVRFVRPRPRHARAVRVHDGDDPVAGTCWRLSTSRIASGLTRAVKTYRTSEPREGPAPAPRRATSARMLREAADRRGPRAHDAVEAFLFRNWRVYASIS